MKLIFSNDAPKAIGPYSHAALVAVSCFAQAKLQLIL
jgi:hypothetical protein